MRAHKPKAVLGLNLKGVSLYDERSKSITRVPVDKVTYVTLDPEDQCYFGVIIQTKESHTGFRLYCFKAERPIAVTFVNSSRELFDLIMKLRQAKKKMKEEREEADKAPQDPDTSNLPAENAPPPSYTSVSKAPDRPPPPMPKQAPAMPPRPQEADIFSFGNEPPPPTFDDVYDVSSGALTSLYGNQPQAPPTFAPPPQPNPFGMAGQPPPPNYPPPPVQEPSITMDLMDAIRNPQQSTTTAYLIGMGMRMPGLGMGPPAGLPADLLLDSNFSQPLLPTNTGGAGPPGGGQPPQGAGGKIDAFSDLVSIARDKTTSKPEPAPPTIFQSPPTNTETSPPLPYRPPDLDFTDAPPTTSGPAPSGFDNTFGALPPAPGTGGWFWRWYGYVW
ncbi:PREDICTED: formin-like protein 20 [Amphimedon queenslandica]|uniref:PID domain-containing protein n=1 Tax=Amphimedon queenslandica TaxID=400682 RepID=A0AAN0JGL3_AMPQE|nr:PREDICTED: formin-like protein 20 [Amphimedon queenslandica]|eukprot:XP_019855783.1 PREDICTED: formin-like protein 20 [Amphimedon queenslandica]